MNHRVQICQSSCQTFSPNHTFDLVADCRQRELQPQTPTPQHTNSQAPRHEFFSYIVFFYECLQTTSPVGFTMLHANLICLDHSVWFYMTLCVENFVSEVWAWVSYRAPKYYSAWPLQLESCNFVKIKKKKWWNCSALWTKYGNALKIQKFTGALSLLKTYTFLFHKT